jgi:undecaprenyl-diphosphatase
MLHAILAADVSLRAWLSAHHTGWLDQVMLVLSMLGEGGTIWLMIAAVATIRQPRLAAQLWQVALAVLLAYLAVDMALKPLIARARPFDALPDVHVVGWRPVTYSFPSGHSASAVAGAFIVSLMLPELRVLLWALAFAIAFSRIYLGVHYPVDVAGGLLVGWAIGLVVTGGRHWYRGVVDRVPADSIPSGAGPTRNRVI